MYAGSPFKFVSTHPSCFHYHYMVIAFIWFDNYSPKISKEAPELIGGIEKFMVGLNSGRLMPKHEIVIALLRLQSFLN